MGYTLGVDLGTTFTAAAADDGSGPVAVKLGPNADAMPSVVAIDDGRAVTGEDAEQILAANPSAGVREVKRRLGDSTPLVLDGTPYGAEAVMGLLLADVISAATAQLGEAPESIVLAHPANWGDFKKDLLSDTARVAGLDDIGLITEPQAAAVHYVRSGELAVGEAVGVYDFGGGTFDAAVVRCADTGPELLGTAQGLERLGGIDLDQAILVHVDKSVDGALRALDSSDPAALAAMAAVRAQCVAAKEALTTASEATVEVELPSLHTQVRITRAEFEKMLRPRIADTLETFDRSLESAGLAASDLRGVVLVGGTSRIPLVGEMVAAHTGRPVVASADHKTVVCDGAAAAAAPVRGGAEEGADGVTVIGPSDRPADYRGGVRKRRLAMVAAGAVVAGGAVAAGATAAGAAPWSDDEGGGEGDVDLAAMDEFEDDAAPAGGGPEGPMSMSAPGGPLAAAARLGPRGVSRRAASDPDGDRGGAGQARFSRESPEGGGTGTAPPPSMVAVTPPDEQFLAARERLIDNLRSWEPPEGADPAAAEAFRADLIDRMSRFTPMPGESVEHALASMRDEFEDQVEDFVQEHELDGIIADQLAKDAEAAEVASEVDGVKELLLERLSGFEAPQGADPDDIDALRSDLEAMIARYRAVPGHTAEEAIEELRFQYANRVRDLAHEMKIDGIIDELTEADLEEETPAGQEEMPADETGASPDEPEVDQAQGGWRDGGPGEPSQVWVNPDGTPDYDKTPGHVEQEMGAITVKYGPPYPDRASRENQPTIEEQDDGSHIVSGYTPEGRHYEIHVPPSVDPGQAFQDAMPNRPLGGTPVDDHGEPYVQIDNPLHIDLPGWLPDVGGNETILVPPDEAPDDDQLLEFRTPIRALGLDQVLTTDVIAPTTVLTAPGAMTAQEASTLRGVALDDDQVVAEPDALGDEMVDASTIEELATDDRDSDLGPPEAAGGDGTGIDTDALGEDAIEASDLDDMVSHDTSEGLAEDVEITDDDELAEPEATVLDEVDDALGALTADADAFDDGLDVAEPEPLDDFDDPDLMAEP